MVDKIKNIVVVIAFIATLGIIMILNLIKPDQELSITERRKLAQFPKFEVKKILDGSFTKQFESYTTDQIISREKFRKMKSIVEFELLRKKDNNNIYVYEDSIIKIEYPLNEKSIINAANKINELNQNYFKNMNCYYAIVPDKNYFTNRNEYVCIDYEKLQNIMAKKLQNIEYINLFDCLQLEDYYVTDIHWKQQNLQKVVNKISTQMNFKNRLNTKYDEKQIIKFNGQYAGEFSIKTKQDYICILENNITKQATVYNYENKKQTSIYDEEKINSNDKYDIYLSGSTPLITITNNNANNSKELIIFRDSFASSLAPLFVEAYNKITLIDIRYMRSEDIENYIQFSNQDVLYIYSTLVLNNSSILK